MGLELVERDGGVQEAGSGLQASGFRLVALLDDVLHAFE